LPNNGFSVEWLTPPTIIEALGPFDLDPCAHPRQFYRTAKRMIAPPRDGLKARWDGKVWLNPPYGNQIDLWLRKLASHGCGIALVPSRTEVRRWFWPYVWESADAVLFVKGRLFFFKPDGTTSGNSGHGSVLVAYGRSCLIRIRDSAIDGRFFELKS
jgi:hypothetical protein